MATGRDWKFWVTLIVGVAGVVVPIWLWQADLASKSMKLRVISVTPLFPSLDPKLDIRLTQGNQVLAAPVLSVLELTNSGGRPISAVDFETPLTIRVLGGRLHRVAVGSTAPVGLTPQIDTVGTTIRVQPLLLNPGDRFSISLLSDGSPPKFLPEARVAGVKQVELEAELATDRGVVRAITGFAAPVLLFVMYWAFASGRAFPDAAPWHRALNATLGIAAMLVSTEAYRDVAEAWGIGDRSLMGGAILLVGLALACLLALPTLMYWRRQAGNSQAHKTSSRE